MSSGVLRSTKSSVVHRDISTDVSDERIIGNSSSQKTNQHIEIEYVGSQVDVQVTDDMERRNSTTRTTSS